MKLSKETLSLLKNFAQISDNLRIYPGDELITITSGQNIFAKVKVKETFPVEVNIHNLNNLLGILTYMENDEIEFGEQSLKIIGASSTFEYRYSARDAIFAPEKGKTIELDTHFQFTLSAADIHMINKAVGITAAPFIEIQAKDNEASIVISDEHKNMTQKIKIGVTNLNFIAKLNVELFRILPETYNVTLSKRKFLHFNPQQEGIPEYFIALDPESIV